MTFFGQDEPNPIYHEKRLHNARPSKNLFPTFPVDSELKYRYLILITLVESSKSKALILEKRVLHHTDCFHGVLIFVKI